MRDLMQSEWLKGLLVLVLALMVAQCGSDDEGCTNCGGTGQSDPGCANEDLTAGLYSFEILPGGVEGCDALFALLAEFGLIPPGPYTFTLPGYDNLPQPVTITLPLPGSPQVTGTLDEVAGDIVLTVDGTTLVPVDLPPFPDLPDSIIIPVNIAGTLCPASEDTVDAELAITIPQAVPPITSGGCTIETELRGTRQ